MNPSSSKHTSINTRNNYKNNKETMKWIDVLFMLILLWSVISTMLLIQQFQSNNALQKQLSNNNNGHKKHDQLNVYDHHKDSKKQKFAKKYDDMMKEHDEKANQRREMEKMHTYHLRNNVPLLANQFPFTRSLDTFKRSSQFYVYVVHSTTTSGDDTNADQTNTSPLEWSEVRWKELVINWGRQTSFDDLLSMTTILHENTKKGTKKSNNALSNNEGIMKKKLILHCLPKSASTTLRRACYKNMKDNCPEIEFPRQQDPFGYRNVTDFFRAVKECKDINHFCVQGGDADMSVINYEAEEEADDDREPYHFVHMVPFRKFDDWVESAIKQIYIIDGHCNRIDNLLDECLGYRELYMELYPKSVLSLLTGMTFSANGKGISSKDKHHILLYNYKDVSTIVPQVSDFFGLDPMPRTDMRHKDQREEGTCPAETSIKFHKCHDETLMKSDAIRGLDRERMRRKDGDRRMKTLLRMMKKAEEERNEEKE